MRLKVKNYLGLILFVIIFWGCQKNRYHLMPEQRQFLFPFPVGSSFRMLKDKTDTVSFKVVKNEITTISCEKNCISEKGYVKIVNQTDENQIWEINMFGYDWNSGVSVKVDTISFFYNSYRLFNDTVINSLEFSRLYKFFYNQYGCQGIMGLSPLKGFGFIRCIYNGDTITYERLP